MRPPASESAATQRGEVPPQVPDHLLLRRIGGGSYGDVWLARNVLGAYRAVKIVYRDRFDHARPFEREFSGIQKFEPISRLHDGLVDILQVGRNDTAGSFYYVMELADDANAAPAPPPALDRAPSGNSPASTAASTPNAYVPRTLASELARRHRLPFEECLPLFLSLAGALGHLHQHGLIHRDIKPSNIIFVNGMAKLADIGLVSEVGGSDSYVGTEGYIPPEGPGTPQADLYSLGKVFYELSTGRDRVEFPSLPIGLDELPEKQGLLELNAVFLRACANDRKDRYQSASEMHADLALLQSGKSLKRLRTIERRLVQATRMGLAAAGLLLLATTAYLFTHYQARLAQRNFERAEAQRVRAERAEQDATERLWHAYLAQACAGRRTDEIGHRHESLDAISKAVALRPDARLPDLRKEAVAALALTDLRLGRAIALSANAEVWPSFTPRLDHYVSWNSADELTLCRVADDQVSTRLTGAGLTGPWSAHFGGGRFLCVARADGSFTVWDVASGRVQLQCPPDADLRGLRFAPEDKSLVAGYADGRLVIRSLGDPGANRTLTLGCRIQGLEMRPDGQAIAVWSDASSVLEIVQLDAGQRLGTLEHNANVLCAAWSPDGSRLAAGCSDNEIRIWDTPTGHLWRQLAGHASQVAHLGFLRDDLLASGSWDGSLRLWNARTGHPLLVVPDGNGRIQYDPDQQRLGVIQSRGSQIELRLYQLTHGDVTRTLAEPRDDASGPWCAEFSPDERWLGSSSYSAVRLWDLDSGRELGHFSNGLEQYLSFNRTDGSLVTCSSSALLRWPLASSAGGEVVLGPPEALIPPAEARALRMATIGADGIVFAAMFEAGIRGFRSGTNCIRLAQSGNVDTLAASPDGRWVAGGYWSQAVARLWRTADGALARELAVSGRTRVAFSPDSRWLVTGSTDEYCFWDVLTGRPGLRIPREQRPGLWGVMAFSPDGRMLAIARTAMLAELVDPTNGEVLASLEHPEPQLISGLAFSPSGTQLAVATEGHLIHLWDLRSLRANLAALKLDWNHPSWPAGSSAGGPVRLRIR